MNPPSSTSPVRHHYVPKFYLRGWVSEPSGTLWRCVLPPDGSLHDKAVSPKATGFEHHLYTLSRETPLTVPSDVSTIESSFFRKIDNDAAVVLPKLARGELDLTDGERTAWALFLLSLYERSPERLEQTEAKAREVLARTIDAVQMGSEPEDRERFDELTSSAHLGGFARNYVRQLMMERIQNPHALARLKRESWCVIDNQNPEHGYVTTDSPLLVDFGERKTDFATLAIALNPQRLFVVHPPEWKGDPDGLDALVSLATYHSAFLIRSGCNFVYSQTRLQDNELIRFRAAAERYLKR